MLASYRIAAVLVILAFLGVAYASYTGLGLSSDAEALARRRSVRGGSLHTRTHFGGGPGFGK